MASVDIATCLTLVMLMATGSATCLQLEPPAEVGDEWGDGDPTMGTSGLYRVARAAAMVKSKPRLPNLKPSQLGQGNQPQNPTVVPAPRPGPTYPSEATPASNSATTHPPEAVPARRPAPLYPSEAVLLRRLFTGYSRHVRPVLDTTSAVTVHVQLKIVNIEDFNEREQQMTTFCWLRLRWRDEFLTWNETEFGRGRLIVPSERVWRPDLVIRNSVDNIYGDIMDKDSDYRCVLFSDGRVQLLTAGKVRTACIVDMTYFPFDQQACYIHFDSWTYPITDLQLRLYNGTAAAFDWSRFREHGQWRLVNHSTVTLTSYFSEINNSFDELMFLMVLQRKPLYYLGMILAPCVIMSVLVLLVFLVPVDSGEKVSLCVTLFLSYSVFQLVVADNMPRTSEYFPVLALYFSASMILSASCLASTLVVLNLHHHPPVSPPPSVLLRGWVPTLLGLPQPRQQQEATGDGDLGTDTLSSRRHGNTKTRPQWWTGSRHTDINAIATGSQTVQTHDRDSYEATGSDIVNNVKQGAVWSSQDTMDVETIQIGVEPFSQVEESCPVGEGPNQKGVGPCREGAELSRKCEEREGPDLKRGEHIQKREVPDQQGAVLSESGRCRDWLAVARVADRFFLGIHVFVSVLTGFVLLGIYPLTRPDLVQATNVS